MFQDWVPRVDRFIEAIERLARAAERIAISLEITEPEWRPRKQDVSEKEEILTRG